LGATVLDPPFDIEAVPDRPAVFLIHVRAGRPYLARTALLRRRLRRLLGERAGVSRLLNLSEVAEQVEYHLTYSRLASSLIYYELARRHFPEDYTEIIKLRSAPFVKVLLTNEFPRTTVTTRLSASQAYQYGPFRSRASAERFEQEVLDLFQVRRCQEDLIPSPDHPGCIYGEMMKCLRPCQEVVGADEYRTESNRLIHFLETEGQSLLEPVASARARLSEELQFEEASRQHALYQRIGEVLKQRDELAAGVDRVCGVAVTPSPESGYVELLFMVRGVWLPALEFRVAATGKEMIPIDRRLREAVEGLKPPRVTAKERGEHLSLLARWFYSSWRDAEWISFPSMEDLPYRRVVRAISKTASGAQTTLFEA